MPFLGADLLDDSPSQSDENVSPWLQRVRSGYPGRLEPVTAKTGHLKLRIQPPTAAVRINTVSFPWSQGSILRLPAGTHQSSDCQWALPDSTGHHQAKRRDKRALFHRWSGPLIRYNLILLGLLWSTAPSAQESGNKSAFSLTSGQVRVTVKSWGPDCGDKPLNTRDRAGTIYELKGGRFVRKGKARMIDEPGVCRSATGLPMIIETQGPAASAVSPQKEKVPRPTDR